ncbi:hypothetical protein DFJ68_3260 [Terracoccus luteus]|uniref:Phosphohydrolase n=1 Tax=Terracoccus luteus TaxID=53356 RepID=A0A495Y0Q8_9MICO|nr:hypothetical protein [Terracoccus luteus]RKT79782.1 hypothetical protein DFJ68_3260 [Terracoccus luteus]
MTPRATPPAAPAGAPLDRPLPGTDAGPPLTAVVARLLRTPAEVRSPDIVTRALLADALELAGRRPARDWSALGSLSIAHRLALQVGAWLLAERAWSTQLGRRSGDEVLASLLAFATLVDALPLAQWFGDDPDRQEEVARAWLRCLGLRPRDETHDVAEDAWAATSTSRRGEALRRAAVEQARADELARRLTEKRAREAAAQYTHV